MMNQFTKYTAAISNADLAAANTAMAAVSGKFVGMFSIPLIADSDPDNIDEDGVYTGTPRYWATVVKLRDSEKSVLKGALSGIASLHYQEINSRKPQEDEDALDAWAASYNFRRPGHIIEAYGTALASGGGTAQNLTTSPALLTQWTSLVKLINMGKSGQRFQIATAGTYELGVRLVYTPVDGVTFYAKAAKNNGVIGQAIDSSDGTMQGSISGALAVNDLIGIGVYASDAAEFKLLSGSKIRLKRTA